MYFSFSYRLIVFITEIEVFILNTVGNSPSVSQSSTSDKIDKVKHYIRIKTHNIIALRF